MFPEFTQFFSPSYLGKPRRIQGIALPLSYRGITVSIITKLYDR